MQTLVQNPENLRQTVLTVWLNPSKSDINDLWAGNYTNSGGKFELNKSTIEVASVTDNETIRKIYHDFKAINKNNLEYVKY